MMGKKSLCALFIGILLLGNTMICVGTTLQQPKLFVDPSTSAATQMDEIFNFDIKIANVTDLAFFEFKLNYNTTVLDAVNCIPLVAYSFLWPLVPGTGEWAPINDTLGLIHLKVYLGSFLLSGNHALVRIVFKATYADSTSCILDLYDTVLEDIGGNPILHDVEDGNYKFVILGVTVETDKMAYLPGENVTIQGNLTLDSLPHEGLVALEVNKPKNYPIVVRTVQIGSTSPSEEVSIIEVVPCDMWGTPKVPPTYKRNVTQSSDYFYVKITLINNDPTEWKTVMVTANIYDVNNVPIGVGASGGQYPPGPSAITALPIIIPEWASLGNATVYVNAFTDWPGRGFLGAARALGTPYCPEENATFEIIDGSQSQGSGGQGSGSGTENYSLTFRLPNNTDAGVYRVYANSFYRGQTATSRTSFGVNAIYVPTHYSTIQEAVDAATPTNNSILVSPGTYNEHVTINKSLTLVGVNPSTTIINGTGTGTVLTVTADNVEISRFTIQNSSSSFPHSAVTLNNSSNSIVSENTVSHNYFGIYLNGSSQENTIRENTITLNNGYGIYISSSGNNDIRDNSLLNNNYGIYINHSSSITLRWNAMIDNEYNFGVFGDFASDYTHSIDTSNTVDGKPIIYWVNQQDKLVPPYAGCVVIVSSTRIAVRDLNLTNNGQGVLFVSTTDSLIERVNTVDNEYGIYLLYSYSNTIIASEVWNNTVGIHQRYCDNNIICHNGFANNTNQVDIFQSSNTWNDSAGKGNYWTDYTGTDDGSNNRTAGDGVGDTLLPHNGVDYYPLINPWTPLHDLALTSTNSIIPYNSSHIYPGWVITVTATVKNEGDFTETSFNIRAYYDGNQIEDPLIIPELAPQKETSINFTWSTTGVSPGFNGVNYTIKAEVSVILGENETLDNTFIDGVVHVKLPGDVDGNGFVFVSDMVLVLMHFGESSAQFPEGDIDGDGVVFASDMVTILINFGAGG